MTTGHVTGLITGYLPNAQVIEVTLDGPLPEGVALRQKVFLTSQADLDAVGREKQGHNADWCAGWNACLLATTRSKS